MKVLVDACVLQHAVTREPGTEQVEVDWGGRRHEAQLISSRAKNRPSGWLGSQVDALPQVVLAAKSRMLILFLAPEIRTELMGAPPDALRHGPWNLFHGVSFEIPPDPLRYSRILIAAFDPPEGMRTRLASFVRSIQDAEFRHLHAALGGNKPVDAFHLITAERAGLDVFLTTDRRLINSVRTIKNWPLKVRVWVQPSLWWSWRNDA